MNHAVHAAHARSHHHDGHPSDTPGPTDAPRAVAADNLTWVALTATLHCLTGCAIGEVLGMVMGTALGLENLTTTVVAIVLAFVFGYLLTMLPLVRSGMPRMTAVRLALAADTASIALMEIIDNAIMWVIPGAMDAGLDSPLFWGSLALSLVVAGLAAWPLNRWLIGRGQGHAVVHAHRCKHLHTSIKVNRRATATAALHPCLGLGVEP